MVYQAKRVVETMESLQVYSEKVRRTMLRVEAKSNLMRKRTCFKMIRDFINVMSRSREAKIISKKHRAKKDKVVLTRVFRIIRKVNMFERNWLKSVRYELYFQFQMKNILGCLESNIKFERTVRKINAMNCQKFIDLLKVPTDKTRKKYTKLQLKLQYRHLRSYFKEIRRNIRL